MKQLLLYIILVSFGLAATAAPVRYCKKKGKTLAASANMATLTPPAEKEKAPSQQSEVCAPSTLVFLHTPQQVAQIVPTLSPRHETRYHSVFHSQYTANPPFAPPRVSFV